MNLAQFNIARVRYPLDDPRMKEFADNVARVNALAEQIDGFVWRLQDGSGNAMGMTVYGDPAILPNLTVWQSAEALERFVFKTLHSRFYGRREEWFATIDVPLVMWWVPERHRPDITEGAARRDHLLANGPSDFAFGWESLSAAQLWKTARCDAPRGQAA
jgi:hypothetical protein